MSTDNLNQNQTPAYAQNLEDLGTSGVQANRKLETFPRPVGQELWNFGITFDTQEFTSKCPITGQPDFASITIFYVPNELMLESKSLKLFLQSFRDEAHFAEALAQMIFEALADALHPDKLEVTLNQTPRGGIGLSVNLDGTYRKTLR